jgi:thiol-disulfide isomerase/thioredoxin
MKNFFLITLLIVLSSCSASKKGTNEKNKSEDLIGLVGKKAFLKAPYNVWFNQKFETYKTDSLTIYSLKKELKGIKIKGFMGSWCGDSKRETPHFYKILEQANFNLNNFELIAVDNNKKTHNNI